MKRSLALDVFRGLTVALMILVNNPGSWTFIYPPFEHAKWHGLTPTDLVFPFFLFAVGNAMALVLPKLKESGQYFPKILKRTLIIFALGLFLNWFPGLVWVGPELKFKSWTWINQDGVMVGLRVLGVLQRIALAYGAAALLIYFFEKRVLLISTLLLLSYWALCSYVGTGDVYSIEGFFGTLIDRKFFGDVHLYQGEGVAFDPEGLMSSIPCIAQVLLGYWVGQLLSTVGPQALKKFLLTGIGLVVVGELWNIIHPINKKLWTGSYVLVTTGLALLVLSLTIWLLDVKNLRGRASTFFEAFGKNPLFIYVLSLFMPKLLNLVHLPKEDGFLTPLQWFYENVCAHFPGDPKNGSLLYSLILVGLYGACAVFLNRRKIYIKV